MTRKGRKPWSITEEYAITRKNYKKNVREQTSKLKLTKITRLKLHRSLTPLTLTSRIALSENLYEQ